MTTSDSVSRSWLPICTLALLLAGCQCESPGGAADGASPGLDGARPDGAPCVPLGGGCALGAECCSGACEDGACAPSPGCAPFGELCTSGAECCSGNCADGSGQACAAGSGCACAPTGSCGAAGSPCASDRGCCNGFCSEGFCASLGACRTAGEPCGAEGLSGSCCSTVCLATDGDEVARCQFLGGCRVQDDLCRTNEDCCSGACVERQRTSDGRSILRCGSAGSCLSPGEICGLGGASSNCCPSGGGRSGCEPTGGGFSRCFGGGSSCVLGGESCMEGGDPCCAVPPGLVCTAGTTRGQICCLPDGEECAFGDLCCGGVCSPGADGVSRCGSSCIADDAPCSTDADCCGCACVSDGSGGQVCTSEPSRCDGCTGPRLGQFCELGGTACCDGPTVVCDPTSDLEFRTCILGG